MPDEARCILHLCRLRGVGIPVVSAFLALTDSERYGVIDIRVWQLLALYEEVDYDPNGRILQVLHWPDYLGKMGLRALSMKPAVHICRPT